MPKFLAPIDLSQNELQNAAIQSIAGDPGSPVEGQIWFNTTANVVKVRRGGSNRVLIESGAIVDGDIAAGAAIALSKLAVDPRARSTHTGTQLAATISDLATVVQAYRLDQFAAPTAPVSMNSQRVTNVAAPSAGTDAARLSDIAATRLDQFAAPTADVGLNSHKLTGLADPTSPQDAATKAYVDAARAGLDVKDSVRAATTASITLSGTQTVDGVALAAGDRVLVKDQGTGSQNGIYVVAAGAWARATDADASAEVTPGMFVFVEEGTTNGDSGFVLTNDGAVTLGTTSLTFAQFSGAGQITAGNGLTKTGNTLDVNPDGSTVEIVGDQVRVKDLGITGAKLAVGAVDLTTNKVTGALPVTNGGTGATTAAGARTNLGVVGKFAGTITGDGTTTAFTVTHSLGSTDVVVSVADSNGDEVYATVRHLSTTQVRVTMTPAPANAATYRVVVIG